jgi:hypothetical protein
MKQKIEKIFKLFLDNLSHTDEPECIEYGVEQIRKLLPRKRYPEKDGWPSINGELLMVCTVDGKIIIEKFGMFDQKLKRKDVDWWIPVSEILEVFTEDFTEQFINKIKEDK